MCTGSLFRECLRDAGRETEEMMLMSRGERSEAERVARKRLLIGDEKR